MTCAQLGQVGESWQIGEITGVQDEGFDKTGHIYVHGCEQ